MKTPKTLFISLAIILLSSCDNTNGIMPPLEETPITVTADITQHTRAGYENGDLLPEKFVIDIIQGDNAKYNYSLVEMTKGSIDNTYSVPEGTVLLWADDTHTASIKGSGRAELCGLPHRWDGKQSGHCPRHSESCRDACSWSGCPGSP